MLRISDLRLPLNHDDGKLREKVLETLNIPAGELLELSIFKRSYDARKKGRITFIYSLDVRLADERRVLATAPPELRLRETPDMSCPFPVHAPENLRERPIIVGAGPCGLFAGLALAQAGFRPILLERGKEVRERSRDTFGFWRHREFKAGSNVQFGEGGAGTFSDGKLNTQIKDRGHHGRRVLSELIAAGAPPEILYVSKPHVGTYRLVKVVENIRQKIAELGGEYHFDSKVTDLLVEEGKLAGVRLEDGQALKSGHVILALGHSARDTFQMLHEHGLALEPKPFSVGFRIEHPQSLIDQAQFGQNAGHPLLGAADYKLVHHCKNGRSVYSFCMCPGGTVVAAASEPESIVTNGMSQYARNGENANSAIVVGIDPNDYPEHPLAGIDLQRRLEKQAFVLGGENYNAPAQRVGDFLAGRPSTGKGSVTPTYLPGVTWCDLSTSLPDYAIAALREALPAFGRKIRGFAMKDAVLTGVETRTSSPIRLLRGNDFQSISLPGLYPAGEGAGYAGGILSSAIDGLKVAEALAIHLSSTI